MYRRTVYMMNLRVSLDKEVIFYGTSLSGTAEWLGVKRLCF